MMTSSISDHYRTAQERIKDEIRSLDEQALSGTRVEDWVKHFMDRFAFQPIRLLHTSLILQPRVERVQREAFPGRLETADREVAVVGLPIESNQHVDSIQYLLKHRANQWYLSSPPQWSYQDRCIFLEIRSMNVNPVSSDPAFVQQEIQKAMQCIEWLNRDIENENAQMQTYIESRVRQRMEAIGAREQRFQSLAEAIGAELRPTPGTERRLYEAPKLRASIAALRQPQPQRTEVPRLEPTAFQVILDVIDAYGRTLERTPGTASKLGEEDMRNLLLAALNAAFDLGAVGEAFSKRGKTDVLLTVPNGAVFIAELKIWDGPADIAEATKQILNYLTWRDSYGLVILLSRRVRFSDVLKAVPDAIRIESLQGDVHEVAEQHWSARHALPGDEYQTVDIHYLAYDIHAEPRQPSGETP